MKDILERILLGIAITIALICFSLFYLLFLVVVSGFYMLFPKKWKSNTVESRTDILKWIWDI